MRRLALFVLSLIVITTSAAFAQSIPNNKWFKACDGKDCIVAYRIPQQHARYLIRTAPSQEARLLSSMLWPDGVDLPYGTTWQIDAGKQLRIPFIQCKAAGCNAQLIINEGYLDSLRAGSTYKLGYTRGGKNHTVSVPLKSFAAAYDGKASMTLDQFGALGGGNLP